MRSGQKLTVACPRQVQTARLWAGEADDVVRQPSRVKHPVTLRLPATLQAPRTVRDALRHELPDAPRGALDDALLLASEVTTNAVLHGRPGGTITVVIDHDHAALSVAIGDEGGPLLVSNWDGPLDSSVQEGGRGLLLLHALAEDWGVVPSSSLPGKVIWFRIKTNGRAGLTAL